MKKERKRGGTVGRREMEEKEREREGRERERKRGEKAGRVTASDKMAGKRKSIELTSLQQEGI